MSIAAERCEFNYQRKRQIDFRVNEGRAGELIE